MGGRRPWRSKLLVAALGVALGAVPGTCAAASGFAVFTAHYVHRAQVETELFARTQALTPAQRQEGLAIGRAVAALNQSILVLYAADQELSASARPLPPQRIAGDLLPALREAQSGVEVVIGVYGSSPYRSRAWHLRAAGVIASARAAERQIAAEIAHNVAATGRVSFRRSSEIQSEALQIAVARLQTTAIAMLDAWLLLADAAWVGSQPAIAQGLAYTAAEIAIPARGQGPAEDSVGVPPRVTDASGQVLPDTGAYRLRGPAGFRGVTVDNLIGTLNVRAGATPGQYTVVYVQGRAIEQVTVQIVP